MTMKRLYFYTRKVQKGHFTRFFFSCEPSWEEKIRYLYCVCLSVGPFYGFEFCYPVSEKREPSWRRWLQWSSTFTRTGWFTGLLTLLFNKCSNWSETSSLSGYYARNNDRPTERRADREVLLPISVSVDYSSLKLVCSKAHLCYNWTSAPIGAWTFLLGKYDRQTDRQTDMRCHRKVSLLICGKF